MFRTFDITKVLGTLFILQTVSFVTLAEDPASGLLEEITVTAQKRGAVGIQDVPLSISAISGENMEKNGYEGFTEYLPKIPGLSFFDRGPGQTKIIMRGISSSERPESSSTVAVYLDEVPVTSPGAPVQGVQPFTVDLNTFDLERVEVLRGPQGTLYGASSMGGTVRLITKKPDLKRVEAKGDVTISTTKSGGENYNLNGMINIPIIEDKLATRIVAYHRHNDGFINNVGLNIDDIDDDEVTGTRFSLQYAPNDNLTITGKISYQQAETDGNRTDDSDAGFPELVQNRPSPESHDEESVQYNLVIDYDLGWGSFLSSTSYDDREALDQNDLNVFLPDFFGITLPGANWQDTNEVDRTIQELRFASAWDNPFQVVMGVYFFDQNQTLLQTMPAPGFDAAVGVNTGLFGTPENVFEGNIFRDITELAFFGELTYEITERLEATVGFRWFDLDQEFRSFSQGFFNGGQTSGQTDNSETGVTPKVSLSYKASDDILLYATAAQGYRFGGISEIVPEAACSVGLAQIGRTAEEAARFDSDSLWNYEFGIKSTLFDQRLVANISAFYIDWSDIQTLNVVPICNFGFVENAGGATSQGVEWELTALPADNLELSFSGSYTEAEFEETPSLGVQEGDRLPGAPRLTLNVSAQYSFPITSVMDGYLRTDYQHTGDRMNGFNGAQRVEMGSFNIVNLRAGMLYKNWEVSLFAKNLFDAQAELSWDSLFGVARNRPRSVGINVKYAYD